MTAAARQADGDAAPPRLLVVASHPIQYQAPWFRALAQVPGLDFRVLFVQRPDARQQGADFGVAFEWDVPLLDGYRFEFVPALRGRGGLRGFFATRIVKPLALLRQLDPDAIVLTGWHVWPLVQLLVAAWWARIPVIMRGESNALRPRPWYTRLVHRALLGRCRAFLPIGRASHAFYRGYGIPESRLFDAPYFVDNARFLATSLDCLPRREALRAGWSIAPAAVCFCFAGKLQPKKRILDLLHALHLATTSSAAPLHLLVVGTGELMDEARALVGELGLPVTFAGFLNQSEIPAAYVAADCLVLPSDHGETWGLVVNEAMACGLPAIVSDRVGCASDLVIEGATGTVFPFGDIGALARKLVQFAGDPQRLQVMGERARDHVLQGYTVEESVRGTLLALRHVLADA